VKIEPKLTAAVQNGEDLEDDVDRESQTETASEKGEPASHALVRSFVNVGVTAS
jgi:hypothetical protein